MNAGGPATMAALSGRGTDTVDKQYHAGAPTGIEASLVLNTRKNARMLATKSRSIIAAAI